MLDKYSLVSPLWYIFLILLFFTSPLNAHFIHKDEIINIDNFNTQVETIGKELFRKTGVSLYMIIIKSIENEILIKTEQKIAQELKPPFILLSLSITKDGLGKVDIYSNDKMQTMFNRNQILSPYPWSGTIIPILTSKIDGNAKEKYGAAMLNGYADIAEQVASSFDIKLDSALGNANKITINIFRAIFYSILIITFSYWLYRKFFFKAL